MNGTAQKMCVLDAGNLLGSQMRGPEWTPYANAIAAHYPVHVPWYLTTRVIFNNTIGLTQQQVFTTQPQQYDVLVMGMSATQMPSPLPLTGFPYLNITHHETGIPWVAPSLFAHAPLPAFAGFPGYGLTSAVWLPDSFFLPRKTQLKISWIPLNLDQTPDVTVNLTMIGVQLIDSRLGATAPRTIVMPNGDEIPVGSRVPWFSTILFGRRLSGRSINIANLNLPALQQVVQYTAPNDCNVEVHDAYASFLNNNFEYPDAQTLLQTKIDNTGVASDWTPMLTPVNATFGSFLQVNPVMPFVNPQLLPAGERIEVVQQNDSTTPVQQGTVTFRGVRLCEY